MASKLDIESILRSFDDRDAVKHLKDLEKNLLKAKFDLKSASIT